MATTLDPVTPESKADTASTETPSDSTGLLSRAFGLKTYTPGVRKIAGYGLALFLIGLVITASWAPSYWVVSMLCSSACMAIGWLTGFLFGVPRVGTTPPSAADSASARINTNLEQISDWLTKILVGVGLTQIAKLPHALAEVAKHISKDFGKSGNDVFSGSMVLYFSTLGFLMGYLLTRLFLQEEFDTESEDKVVMTTEVKETQHAQKATA